MVLIVDIGNTVIKLAVVDQINVFDFAQCTNHEFKSTLKSLRTKYPFLKQAVKSEVGFFDKTNDDLLFELYNVYSITKDTRLPFENEYQSNSLGVDRKSLVTGALNFKDENQAILIVSLGTCITYDYLDASNTYLGGAISPGIKLRYESLHNFTQNLPLLTPEMQGHFIGNNTQSAIHNGVLNGVIQEIKGTQKQYKKMNLNLTCLLTGGDAQLLHPYLKSRFFATPFLMLHGIYNLYTFNK